MILNEILLLEDRVDFIANSPLGAKLVDRAKQDRSAPRTEDPKDILNALTQADPSKKKLNWLVNRYINGEFKIEDTSRLKQDLELFDKVRRHLEIKDIGQYTVGQLYYALKPFEGEDVVSNKEEQRRKTQQLFNDREAILIHKDNEVTVVLPKTQEASCWFGKGTKWCTAATQSQNMFHSYDQYGPLFIIMLPEGKYQLWVVDFSRIHLDDDEDTDFYADSTIQLMDKADEPVDFKEFFSKHTHVKQIIKEKGSKYNPILKLLFPTNSREAFELIRYSYDFHDIPPLDAVEAIPEKCFDEEIVDFLAQRGAINILSKHVPRHLVKAENIKTALMKTSDNKGVRQLDKTFFKDPEVVELYIKKARTVVGIPLQYLTRELVSTAIPLMYAVDLHKVVKEFPDVLIDPDVIKSNVLKLTDKFSHETVYSFGYEQLKIMFDYLEREGQLDDELLKTIIKKHPRWLAGDGIIPISAIQRYVEKNSNKIAEQIDKVFLSLDPKVQTPELLEAWFEDQRKAVEEYTKKGPTAILRGEKAPDILAHTVLSSINKELFTPELVEYLIKHNPLSFSRLRPLEIKQFLSVEDVIKVIINAINSKKHRSLSVVPTDRLLSDFYEKVKDAFRNSELRRIKNEVSEKTKHAPFFGTNI